METNVSSTCESTQTSFLSKEVYAVACVALSAIMYGIMGYCGITLIRESFSVANMLFWRFGIAALWMLGWEYGQSRVGQVWSLGVRPLLIPFLLGAFCYSIGTALYFMASQKTGTGLAMVIFFSYPMFIALFAWIQSPKWLNPYLLISLLGIVVGLMMLKGNNTHPLSLMGIGLGIVSAFFYAVYIFVSKQNVRDLNPGYLTLTVCIGGATMALIVATFTHALALPPSLKMWAVTATLGIVATAIPIQLMLEGLKTISSLKASILSVLEPVVTLMVGAWALGESMTVLQAIGVIVVLFWAIVIQFVRE